MKFADFILSDAVKSEIKATDKQGVIREIVKSILDAGGIKKEDYEGIVKAIIKREELGSTGIGRGIAVPHTKHPSIKRIVGCVAISADGIDFDSIDREMTQLFFLLISPQDGPGDHLRALEHITRQLKDDTFCRFLKQSKTKEDILSLLEEADNNMFGK
jgi:PTS system fructose-specific IIA component/PTS system nitrogen regulatory IIA component